MKKYFQLLSLLLLISFTSVAQAEKNANKESHLVFTLESDNFYYNSKSDSSKRKIERLDTLELSKIITDELIKSQASLQNFNVVISGDGLMTHEKFELLLESLFKKKIYSVKIITSLYDQ